MNNRLNNGLFQEVGILETIWKGFMRLAVTIFLPKRDPFGLTPALRITLHLKPNTTPSKGSANIKEYKLKQKTTKNGWGINRILDQ